MRRLTLRLPSMARILLLALCAAEVAGCASTPTRPASTLSRFEYSQIHMGVRARIVLYATAESVAAEAAGAAFNRISELDAIMSDYRADSELMRLCGRAGQGPVRVSDELFEVLAFAVELHDRSDGVFDVTAGPVVRLWREMRRSGELAAPEEIEAARTLVGSQWMVLNAPTQTVELRKPGMQLDLGGIAKGFACDSAAAVLRDHGVTRYLVSMAGDIVVGEAPPGRRSWEIAIEGGVSPPSEDGATKLSLVNSAVSTSGDAEQFVEINGIRYSHIVDPRTGLGSSRRIAATVIAPRAMLSDSLATALCLLPAEARLELAGRYSNVGVMIEEIEGTATSVQSSWMRR